MSGANTYSSKAESATGGKNCQKGNKLLKSYFSDYYKNLLFILPFRKSKSFFRKSSNDFEELKSLLQSTLKERNSDKKLFYLLFEFYNFLESHLDSP